MTREEILEKAIQDYPPGTKFIPAHLYDDSINFTVKNIPNYEFYNSNNDLIVDVIEPNPSEWITLLYYNNKWATITQAAPELTDEQLIAKAILDYPVGARFNSIGGNINCEITEDAEFELFDGEIQVYADDGNDYIGAVYSIFSKKWAKILSKPDGSVVQKIPNRDILTDIITEEGITNIDLQDKGFMIDFGDILNTETKTGDQYYLLGTYIFIPYTFEPNYLRLHRAIINELEADPNDGYKYSGFVHFEGGNTGKFCYGECGVDHLCNTIRLEGLDSDKFNMLMIKLHTYLSTSSHDSASRKTSYRKLEKQATPVNTILKIKDICTINDIKYPLNISKITTNQQIEKVVYDKPYIDVLKEFEGRAFTYNNVKIIPKVVRHELVQDTKTIEENIRINLNDLKEFIKQEQLQIIYDQINNKAPITFQNLLYKLPNKLSGVDGCVYI
jgi:hypothetical protein